MKKQLIPSRICWIVKKDRDSILNGVEAAFNKHHLSYNPVTQTIKIIDTSQRKPIDPVMDFILDSVRFIGTFANSRISILFKTINGGISYNPRCEFIILSIKDGKVIQTDAAIKESNSIIKSYGTAEYLYTSGVLIPKKVTISDTSYFYFKALYSNREIKGKDQPPLRGLFYIALDSIPKNLSQIRIHQVDNSRKREQLKKALIYNKEW